MSNVNPGTIAEFQQRAAAFTTYLAEQSERANPLEDLPEDLGQWQQVRVTLTCRTEGCANFESSWEQVLYLSAAGAQAICSPCNGAPHLLAHFADGPLEVPNLYQPPAEPGTGPGDQEGYVSLPSEDAPDGR